MAEAAVDPARFFCHGCSRHFRQSSTDLICPHCSSGFVEEIEHDTSLDTSSQSDVDVEEYHNGAASALELLGGSFMNYVPGIANPNGEFSGNDGPFDPISFFSFSMRPSMDSNTASGSSQQRTNESNTSGSEQPDRGRPTVAGYNLRIRAVNPQNNQGGPPDPMSQTALVEGLLQQLISGADPSAMFGGGGGTAIFNTGGTGGPLGMFSLHGNPADYAWGSNGLDDVITRLLGQLESSGAPPASQTAIQRLSTVTISKEHVDANKDCSVCMESFVKDDKAKRLPCEHMFHIKCIDQWLKLHNTCPICRTNIESNDTTSCPGSTNINSQSTSGPSTSGI
uniref:E3 ubiquitin-protein ligase RNF126-B-like n=1 Tax=Styela clava TaxID=7725 RepID=UPI001939768A|nr:E3 ubiquitin-protein ligase RNF126-B-like [Styela clava]